MSNVVKTNVTQIVTFGESFELLIQITSTWQSSNGARLVTSSEPNEGVRMDEGLIKQLTGGDKVSASYKGGHMFDYKIIIIFQPRQQPNI
ncbi:hypothetical protein EfmAA290_24570 [Enterococcus faecium]|nr:hypothetical protein EfmAA290_24570 [Enterococcus faecium]